MTCANCGHSESYHLYSDEEGHVEVQPCCAPYGRFTHCRCWDFIPVEEIANA